LDAVPENLSIICTFHRSLGWPAAAINLRGRRGMRRLLFLAVVAGIGLSNTGCFLNAYSSDPNERMEELLVQSEDLRQINGVRQRIWFVDMPSHMTPDRVHGGVSP
jgi:hypothetical protein